MLLIARLAKTKPHVFLVWKDIILKNKNVIIVILFVFHVKIHVIFVTKVNITKSKNVSNVLLLASNAQTNFNVNNAKKVFSWTNKSVHLVKKSAKSVRP